MFESLEGNQGMFEEFMLNLEKIYTIEKLSWMWHRNEMANPTTTSIELSNGVKFNGNLAVQNELMIQTQRNLMSAFFLNNDEYYIVNNYRGIVPYRTTGELKTNFLMQ